MLLKNLETINLHRSGPDAELDVRARCRSSNSNPKPYTRKQVLLLKHLHTLNLGDNSLSSLPAGLGPPSVPLSISLFVTLTLRVE